MKPKHVKALIAERAFWRITQLLRFDHSQLKCKASKREVRPLSSDDVAPPGAVAVNRLREAFFGCRPVGESAGVPEAVREGPRCIEEQDFRRCRHEAHDHTGAVVVTVEGRGCCP